ncbi:MAG: hypothetical protein WC684_06835, partial [Hyphomicrobium sp.]
QSSQHPFCTGHHVWSKRSTVKRDGIRGRSLSIGTLTDQEKRLPYNGLYRIEAGQCRAAV